MIRIGFIAIACVCSLVVFQPITAQEYDFKHFTVAEGLGQSQVSGMLEDQKGRIWIGTLGGGISIFDGIEFTTLNTEDGLCGNYILQMAKSHDSIWVAAEEGISLIVNDKIKTWHETDGLPEKKITQIFLKGKSVWIGSELGLRKGEFGNGKLVLEKELSLTGAVSALAFFEKALWVGLSNDGIAIINPETKTLLNHLPTKQFSLPREIRCLKKVNSQMFIGTYGGGLFQFANQQLKQILSPVNNSQWNIVLNIQVDNQQIVVSTLHAGLLFIDIKTGLIKGQFNQSNGLPTDFITCSLHDSWGNWWIGTSGRGVLKKQPYEMVHYREFSGLQNTVVTDVLLMPDSQIFFSTKNGYLYVVDQQGQISSFLNQPNNLKQTTIRCLMHDGNHLYLGTDGDGIYRFDGNSWKHFGREQGLGFRWVKDMLCDQYGRIWVATSGGGVYLFDGEKFSSLKALNGLAIDRAECLLEDAKGNLWIGTRNQGLIRIEGMKNQVIFNQMGDVGIRSLTQVNRMVYAATPKGLYQIDSQDSVTLFGRKNGLTSINLYALATAENKLFVGHDRGIDVLKMDQNPSVVTSYGYRQGFTGIEVTQNAIIRRKNQLWCATVNGLTELAIEEKDRVFKAKSQLVSIQSFDSILDSAIYQNKTFTHNQNSFTFHIKGINQADPQNVEIKWKLEGFDENWNSGMMKIAAYYPRLLPGSYQLNYQVGLKNQPGQIQKSFAFTISRPFWQTPLFLWLNAIALTLIIGFIVFLRIKVIKSRNEEEKKQLVLRNQLLELKAQALQMQMNPHFIFNALDSVKGLIASQEEKSAKLYLARFAKLMRLILENSRLNFVPLTSEVELITLYLQLEQLAKNQPFVFEVLVANEVNNDLEIPPMLIQPFVENAVKHAMRYRGAEGKVMVLFCQEDNTLICKIEDNGPGRQAVSELQLKEQKHKSLSFEISNERLANFNTGTAHYGVEIEDIKGLNQIISGTLVSIRIPVKD